MNKEQLLAYQEETLKAQGQTQITIYGNCMWPVLRDGDVVTIEKSSRKEINVGDVAIFKIHEGALHANICFNKKTVFAKTPEKDTRDFFGKAIAVERKSKVIDLEKRSLFSKIMGMIICPSNPYFLGAFRKAFNFDQES